MQVSSNFTICLCISYLILHNGICTIITARIKWEVSFLSSTCSFIYANCNTVCRRRWHVQTRASAVKPITAKLRGVSKPRGWKLLGSYRSAIRQLSRHRRCRGVCLISERLQSLNPKVSAFGLHDICRKSPFRLRLVNRGSGNDTDIRQWLGIVLGF